jgi:hypothetical protein
MEFAQLMTLFRDGQNEGRKRGYVTQGACDADGIRAVVRALRDEIASKTLTYALDGNEVEDLFNEILGDEPGPEKAAGSTHGSPELDEDARKLEAMGQDAGLTLEDLFAAAIREAGK